MPDRFLRASDLGSEEEHGEWKTGRARRAHGRARRCRTGRSGHRYGEGERGPLEPAPGRDRAGAEPARPRRRRAGRRSTCRASTSATGGGVLRRGVPALRDRRPARDDRARPDARPLRRRAGRACRASGRRATTTRRPTRRPGRRRSPRSTGTWSCGSRASSPATRR